MQGWRPMNGSRDVYQKKKNGLGISVLKKNLGRGFFF